MCGVSNAIDGGEDDMIHCFKPEGSCNEGRDILRKAAEELNSAVANPLPVAVDEQAEEGEADEDGYLSDASVEFL